MMSPPRSPEFESLVGEAVRGFMQTRRAPPVPAQSVRLPLTIRSDADLAELVRWFKLLCASDALRERFVSGAITLDLELAPESKAVPVAAAVRTPGNGAPQAGLPMAIDESVITEAVLRRQHAGGQVVSLRRGAVITPAARDYARTAGIRMERSE
jgi:hypothetical protein